MNMNYQEIQELLNFVAKTPGCTVTQVATELQIPEDTAESILLYLDLVYGGE